MRACVPFYGAIPWDQVQPDYEQSVAAYLGHYAVNDGWATLDGAKRLEAHLQDLGKEVSFHYYEGTDHAFFNDSRPEAYNPQASAVAWERTLEFFRSHL